MRRPYCLRVQRSKAKGWISKGWVPPIVVQGRRRGIGIGAYPLASLAATRTSEVQLVMWSEIDLGRRHGRSRAQG